MNKKYILVLALCSGAYSASWAQKVSDVVTPLHAVKVDYPVPYTPPATNDVVRVLNRVHHYLDSVTPAGFMDKRTGKPITNMAAIDTNTVFQTGDFRLTSYEWGVTYSGMLAAGEATGDKRYSDYTAKRLSFLAQSAPAFRALYEKNGNKGNPLRQMLDPHALDDAGAMCAAVAKLLQKGEQPALRAMADHYIRYVSTKEYRLPDGSLARNRPQKNTLWLDDLYMSVPAMAAMGKLTGEQQYFDDAVKQVTQFSRRMYNSAKGVYMHGWVESMEDHPQFHWARANGWAFMAMTELLDALPQQHPGRATVLEQYKALAKGLVSYQSSKGFWHQLLDRNDSYLETSATAIYAYCLSRGINKGWLDPLAYGPATVLAWNAVATKVNERGQVEGTCVGTGMAFDPAFYYYRPTNVFAAHGYGPVLLAGAEVLNLLKQFSFEINDSALQLKKKI